MIKINGKLWNSLIEFKLKVYLHFTLSILIFKIYR